MMNPNTILIQGAGRGLGLAFVHRLLAGKDAPMVFATARDPQKADALQRLAAEYGSNRLRLFALDLRDQDSILAVRGEIGRSTDRLESMLVCGGLLHDSDGLWPEKQLTDIQPENLAASFAVNASGPLLMIKHCHDLLTHGERAVIAALSARVGSIGDNHIGGWYAYRAAKAAQNQFIRTASIELRRKSRQLICVGLHPGTIDTGLSAPFQKRVPAKQLQSPEQAAGHLLDVVAELRPKDSGQVFDWAGERVEP